MPLKVEITDAALFLYPEFVLSSKSLFMPGKGFKLTPSSRKPSSTVENIVMSKTTAQSVVEAIDKAIETLSDECRAIITVKYGWHWEGEHLIVTEPMGTKQTYAVLHKLGEFNWCESYFKRDLQEIRDVVGKHLDELGSVLRQAFGAMPKRRKKARKVSDEEFEKIRQYLSDKGVNFTP